MSWWQQSGVTTEMDPSGEVRRVVRIGIIIFLLFFVVGGGWLAFAPLSGAVIAPGVLKVEDNRKTIQHLEGGIVRAIFVREGQEVKAGQTLLQLADTQTSAGAEVLADQLQAELARQARLEAEQRLADSITFPPSLQNPTNQHVAEMVAGETTLFQARRQNLEGQIAMLKTQIAQTHAEVAGLRQQIRYADESIQYLVSQTAAFESLEKQGFVAKVRLMDQQRALAEKRERRGEYQADVAAALQKVAELELRMNSLRHIYVQEAARDLEDVRRRIPDLQTRLIPARDALQRLNVRAPVSGQVVGLRVHTVGGVVAPREALLDIVPQAKRLLIEAKVPPTDIDDVRPGQTVEVRLSAFKQRNLPYSLGRVESVSQDVVADPRNPAELPYYLARIVLDPASLALPEGKQLVPGMPAETYIQTGKRTPLEYLLDSVTASLRHAAREP